MRTETYTMPAKMVTETYYEYSELSEDAKEKVRDMFYEWRQYDSGILEEDYLIRLGALFPNSGLKVQFSNFSCQGDGVDIYGKISLLDLLEKVKDNFSEKEYKFFKWAFSEFDGVYDMPGNRRYTYSCNDMYGYTDNVNDNLYWSGLKISDDRYDLLEKFNKIAGDFLVSLCNEFANEGYEFFYNITEEEVKDACESAEYEFLEDGTLVN